jgi:hypothetical protein
VGPVPQVPLHLRMVSRETILEQRGFPSPHDYPPVTIRDTIPIQLIGFRWVQARVSQCQGTGWENVTRMILAFLSGLMKVWIIDRGIGGGYCESVSRQMVLFVLDRATG